MGCGPRGAGLGPCYALAARAAGFAHYLVKPVDPARLLALMAAFGADAGPAQRQSPDDSAMAPLN